MEWQKIAADWDDVDKQLQSTYREAASGLHERNLREAWQDYDYASYEQTKRAFLEANGLVEIVSYWQTETVDDNGNYDFDDEVMLKALGSTMEAHDDCLNSRIAHSLGALDDLLTNYGIRSVWCIHGLRQEFANRYGLDPRPEVAVRSDFIAVAPDDLDRFGGCLEHDLAEAGWYEDEDDVWVRAKDKD